MFCIIFAISAAAPLELLMASVSFRKSASDALTIASRPDMASLPAMPAAYSAFCASVKSENLSRNSTIRELSGFIAPLVSVRERFKSSIYAATSLDGLAKLVSILRKDVPAWDAFIPEFAIRPIATAVSSALYPNAPATGATYLNVSPSMATLVFALELAAARISAKCPLSAAVIPNPVRASVTISEVKARLSPEAAAKSMIPLMPLSISSVFHPAMAIYSMALAASVALNFVEAPISFALSVSASRSFPDAPEIACTLDIPASKSDPTFKA